MNPLDLITFIQRAMGFGAQAGTPIGEAIANSTVFADAADGQRMNSAPTPTSLPILAREAGAGRGFVNPPRPNPNVRLQGVPALTPLQAADVGASAPVTPVMAATAPDTTPDNIDAGGGQNIAMTAPVSDAVVSKVTPEPGILSKAGTFLNNQFGFDQPDFLSRFGNALAVAGSADPARSLAMLRQAQAEDEKNRAARAALNRPKIVGSAGPNGAIQLLQMPDGSIVPRTLDEVVKMTKDIKSADFAADVQKALLIEKAKDEIKAAADERKRAADSSGERVQAGLNVQQLNQIADSLEKTDTATGPVIGLLPKWARDIVTPQGASLQDAAERIIQGGLRATLGGQFTQVEGDRFLARAYNPRLSEQQNAANLRTIAREIAAMQLDKDNALKYFQANGTLEGFVPNANAGAAPAAPAARANPAIEAQLKAAGKPYDPANYEYRIGANGEVLARKK